ncbi:NADH-quinone oxidoreductase subunit C [Ktedonobacter racemifer]|uniref:NADH-quinone oxidoreductase subunit C n=1 Tax=Ktedonobacter racemifer DSM 44963 TaxID=485913 RepID=D6TEK8_KTERA|nr:NADH-quinone oxidoreductase subunit C [Ktedonobacter racemifer]EFH90381.1 NADH (or F420H2) dehydrogenase, subunit C [Ktedonobacter racemifer DSM 44963]
MDLVPRSTNMPSATTGYRDQNAALARDLAPLSQITGKPVNATTLKGDFLGLVVDKENLVAVCRFVRDQLGFDLLVCVSGVDMLDHLESVYHLRSTTRAQLLQIKVRIEREKPEVDSVVSVYPTANWLERETYDMYGIRFAGHPDLRRMLLDDDFEGYPLLKDFKQVPMTAKPRATTQIDPNMAVSGKFQQQHLEHVVQKKLGQGLEERLHPGTPTFGHAFQDYQEAGEQQADTE